MNLNDKDIARFEAKIDKSPGLGPKGDCWEWIASCDSSGYGCFGVQRKIKGAHRVSWIIYLGPIPKGLYVLHACDNPKCVNPEHLRVGTQKDNVEDMYKKGRQPDNNRENNPMFGRTGDTAPMYGVTGEQNPYAKLTWKEVNEIRRLYAIGDYTQQQLADTFSVDQPRISMIVRNKIWVIKLEEIS